MSKRFSQNNYTEQHKNLLPPLAVVLLPGLFLLLTSAFYPLGFLPVLDAKRMLQLGIFAAITIFALSWLPLRIACYTQLRRIRRFDAITLALFFAVGLFSALRLAHPSYALIDVSMILVMLVLAFITAAGRDIAGIRFDRWGVLLLASMGFAVSVQEFMGIVVGWVNGAEFSYQQALIHFAHPRFFNHLQTWSIPILAALPLLFPQRRGIKIICVILLGLQWFLVILTAARGTTVGLVAAMVFVALWLPDQRRFWLRYQIGGLLAALLIYAAVLLLNTLLIPQSGDFYANSVGRPMMHTSGRSMLWRLAIEDGLNNPAQGTGPTRYACESDRFLPAHAHSFPFRIMGEWGLIAFALMLLLAGRIAVGFLQRLKSLNNKGQTDPPLRTMLAISLIAGVIHACLSGVLLMPASQTAMILVAGWMLSLTRTSDAVDAKSFGARILLATVMVVACTQFIFAAGEISRLPERTIYADDYGPMVPRFWQEGRVCEYSYPDERNDSHR